MQAAKVDLVEFGAHAEEEKNRLLDVVCWHATQML